MTTLLILEELITISQLVKEFKNPIRTSFELSTRR